MENNCGCVDMKCLGTELSLTYEIPLKVCEVLQKSGDVGTDCDRLLLDDSPSPLGDDLAPAGLCPSFWVDSNEAPEKHSGLKLEGG